LADGALLEEFGADERKIWRGREYGEGLGTFVLEL